MWSHVTIAEIFKLLPDDEAIAAACDGASAYAVKKWRTNGIPEKHWSSLFRLQPELTPSVLHSANQRVRAAA